jgi:hypothetical protein
MYFGTLESPKFKWYWSLKFNMNLQIEYVLVSLKHNITQLSVEVRIVGVWSTKQSCYYLARVASTWSLWLIPSILSFLPFLNHWSTLMRAPHKHTPSSKWKPITSPHYLWHFSVTCVIVSLTLFWGVCYVTLMINQLHHKCQLMTLGMQVRWLISGHEYVQ